MAELETLPTRPERTLRTGLRRGVLPAGLFAVGSALLLLPVARLDFDRHHDGYMVAQAIAVHDGLSLHEGVFAQYGPLMTWVQAVLLDLPQSPALALRLGNVALVALTAFLLADVGRFHNRVWPVRPSAGWWAAVSWVVLADVWSGIPMLPWSSTLTAALSVGFLYCVARCSNCFLLAHTARARAWAVAAGVCVGLLPFARINPGVPLVIAAVVMALVLRRRASERLGGAMSGAVLGAIGAMVAVQVALGLSGATADYISQAILFPLNWAGSGATNVRSQAAFVYTMLVHLVPALMLVAGIGIQSLAASDRSGFRLSTRRANSLTVALGAGVVVYELLIAVAGRRVEGDASAVGWLPRSLTPLGTGYLYTTVGVIFLVAVWVLLRQFSSARHQPPGRDQAGWVILATWGLVGLVQVQPVWDPRHAWWALPAGLLLVFGWLGSFTSLSWPTRNPFWLPLAASMIVSAAMGVSYLSLDRVPAPADSVAKGMLVSPAEVRELEADLRLLGRLPADGRATVFLVEDGDMSVLNGRYSASDAYFVGWGPVPRLEGRLEGADFIVVSRPWGSSLWGDQLRSDGRFSPVESNDRYTLYIRTNSRSS